MKPPERYIMASIINDLEKKMVYIGGTMQIGKARLAIFLFEIEAKE